MPRPSQDTILAKSYQHVSESQSWMSRLTLQLLPPQQAFWLTSRRTKSGYPAFCTGDFYQTLRPLNKRKSGKNKALASQYPSPGILTMSAVYIQTCAADCSVVYGGMCIKPFNDLLSGPEVATLSKRGAHGGCCNSARSIDGFWVTADSL